VRPIVSLPPISLLQENDIKEQPPKTCIFADFRGLFPVIPGFFSQQEVGKLFDQEIEKFAWHQNQKINV